MERRHRTWPGAAAPELGGGGGHTSGNVPRSLCFWWGVGASVWSPGGGHQGPVTLSAVCWPLIRCSGPNAPALPGLGLLSNLQLLSLQKALRQEGEFGETHAGLTQGPGRVCVWGCWVERDEVRPQEAWESSPPCCFSSGHPLARPHGDEEGAPSHGRGSVPGLCCMLGRPGTPQPSAEPPGRQCVLGEVPQTRLSALGPAAGSLPPQACCLPRGLLHHGRHLPRRFFPRLAAS